MDKKTDQAQDLLEGQEILPGFTAQEVPPAQAAQEVNETPLSEIYDPVKAFYAQHDLFMMDQLNAEFADLPFERYAAAEKEALEAGNVAEAERLAAIHRDLSVRLEDILNHERDIKDTAEQRYIDSFAGAEDKAAAIMEDVKKILDSITKKHYLRYQQGLASHLGPALKGRDNEKDSAISQTIKDLAKIGPENCEFYLMTQTRVQFNALTFYGLNDEILANALKAHVEKLFNREYRQQRRNEARQRGALTSIGGHLAFYSSKGLENVINVPSVFAVLTKEKQVKAPSLDESGQFQLFTLSKEDQLVPMDEANIAFLGFINQAAIKSDNAPGNTIIGLWLPGIFPDIEIDARPYSDKRKPEDPDDLTPQQLRYKTIMERLLPLKDLLGRTPDGSLYLLAGFHSYDRNTETLFINAPFFFYLKNKYLPNGKALNQMLQGSVLTEPNNEAVELAKRIIDGLLQRGARKTPDDRTYKARRPSEKETTTITLPDGSRQTKTVYFKTADKAVKPKTDKVIFTYETKWSSLIDQCPQLKMQLDDILAAKKTPDGTWKTPERYGVAQKEFKSKPNNLYNKKLSDTIKAAFKIIFEKSDVPQKYKNLKISPVKAVVPSKPGGRSWEIVPPTKKTLDGYLRITHEGAIKDDITPAS